jgi:diguanylate cyclase (GGDEF)-like protein
MSKSSHIIPNHNSFTAKLIRFFTVPPDCIKQNQASEYFGIFIACFCAYGVNIVLPLGFIFEGLYGLAAVSIISVAMWTAALILTRKGNFEAALIIGTIEIIQHVLIVVWVIGTAYGMQVFIWAAVCYTAINPGAGQRNAIVLSSLSLASLVAITYVFPPTTDVKPYKDYIDFIYVGFTVIASLPTMIVLMVVKSVLIRKRKKLARLANKDLLTGLYNRRFFYDFLESRIRHFEKKGEPFTLAMVDIDHFKAVNDSYGHDIGDQVLVDVSKLLKGALRESDSIARWGGEEFLLILRKCDTPHCSNTLTRIMDTLKANKVSLKSLSITASVGAAEATSGETIDQLIKRADVALYQAKKDGRDRVVIA